MIFMKYIIKGHGKFQLYNGIEEADSAMEALIKFLKSYNINYNVMDSIDEKSKGKDYFSVSLWRG